MKVLRAQLLLWILGMVLLSPAMGVSQIRVSMDNELPANPEEGDWFLDYNDREAWHCVHGNWKLYSDEKCTGIDVCGDFVLLRVNYRTEVVSQEGLLISYYLLDISEVVCHDSLMVWRSYAQDFYVDVHGTAMAFTWNRSCGESRIDSLGNQYGYCVPQMILDSNSTPLGCEVLKNWGILGTNGRWLISPEYDGPFEFVDGVAEVSYYGKKRKINEKGEVVE